VLAVAALCAAPAAFAEGFQAEVGLGSAHTSQSGVDPESALVLDAAFGYRFTPNVGVRALAFGEFDGNRIGGPQQPSFEDFTGLEATGHAALASNVNLMGGLGIGTVSWFHGFDGATKASQTTPVLSGGLQWKPRQHFAMELHADYLTSAKVLNYALLFEIPF
jgi:hypothetical protein